jgi:ubiquitin thioesterase protein OTUB1
VGFDEVIIDDFMEVIVENMKKVDKEGSMKLINNRMESDYMVMFMRMLTSTSLKQNSILYEGFLEDG